MGGMTVHRGTEIVNIDKAPALLCMRSSILTKTQNDPRLSLIKEKHKKNGRHHPSHMLETMGMGGAHPFVLLGTTGLPTLGQSPWGGHMDCRHCVIRGQSHTRRCVSQQGASPPCHLQTPGFSSVGSESVHLPPAQGLVAGAPVKADG